jgi:hypothetical protein
VSDTNVYWTPYDAAGNLSLITAPKCGGTAVTLDPYIESTFGPTWVGLAVDSRNVYWVTPFGLVAKAGLAGGTPETLVPGTTAGASGGPAVDDTNVYWIGATDAILDVPINGGAISTLAMLPTVQYGGVSWSVSPQCNMAIYNETIYMTALMVASTPDGGCFPTGAIVSMPVHGGSMTLLTADSITYPCGIAVDATGVYWADNEGGVAKVPLSGGASTTISQWCGVGATSVALDSSRVYWAQDSYIGSAPKDALDMKDTIISGNVFAVAVDSTAVYWTDGNSVMRHTPK